MSSEHISKTKRTSCPPPSTRRSVQFLVALYVHALALAFVKRFHFTKEVQGFRANSRRTDASRFFAGQRVSDWQGQKDSSA
jgi:hypothetical protein